jgi:hypothetical protein
MSSVINRCFVHSPDKTQKTWTLNPGFCCSGGNVWGLKTSSDRIQGQKGGKLTKLELENGFRKTVNYGNSAEKERSV